MADQIELLEQLNELRREDDVLAHDANGCGVAGVLADLKEELAVICAYASIGSEVSYDAEKTESYFTLIEAAAKKATDISDRLPAIDAARAADNGHSKPVIWPTALDPIDATPEPRQSSFRRRLGLKP